MALKYIEARLDSLEPHLPPILQEKHSGDIATWLQHWLISLGATALGLGIGFIVGLPVLGARIGSTTSFLYYLCIREKHDAEEHMKAGDVAFKWERRGTWLKAGWAGDAIGDLAGPLLNTLVTYTL